jgi:hypothetical protein
MYTNAYLIIAIVIAIGTVLALPQIHALAKQSSDTHYNRGYADGCQDRKSGAGNGPNSLLMGTGGPNRHTQSYLTGWQDGYDNC